jgi:hypothetical protein
MYQTINRDLDAKVLPGELLPSYLEQLSAMIE